MNKTIIRPKMMKSPRGISPKYGLKKYSRSWLESVKLSKFSLMASNFCCVDPYTSPLIVPTYVSSNTDWDVSREQGYCVDTNDNGDVNVSLTTYFSTYNSPCLDFYCVWQVTRSMYLPAEISIASGVQVITVAMGPTGLIQCPPYPDGPVHNYDVNGVISATVNLSGWLQINVTGWSDYMPEGMVCTAGCTASIDTNLD